MTSSLPTLDEMMDELGLVDYARMQIAAEREWRSSEYFYRGSAAKRAFVYNHMVKTYAKYLEGRRAKDNAGREVLDSLPGGVRCSTR